MIYTFTIDKKPKAIEAENLDKAISKMIKNYYYSFCSRKIHFISSNDSDAPKEEMVIYAKGLYYKTRMMRPITKN